MTRAVSLAAGDDAETEEDLGVQENRIVNHLDLGKTYTKLKQWADAEANLAKAAGYVAPMRTKLPKDLYFLRDDADIAEAKGDLLAARGSLEPAMTTYREAVRLWEDWIRLAVESPYTKLNLERLRTKLARLAQ